MPLPDSFAFLNPTSESFCPEIRKGTYHPAVTYSVLQLLNAETVEEKSLQVAQFM